MQRERLPQPDLRRGWTPLVIRNLFLGCRSFGEIHEKACPERVRTIRWRQAEKPTTVV